MQDKDRYVTGFATFQKRAKAPKWMTNIRRSAIDRYAETGMPTTRDEQWRFTRIRPIASIPFERIEKYETKRLSGKQPTGMTFDDTGCLRLVFVNGCYAPDLSNPGRVPDCAVLTGLSEAFVTHPGLLQPHMAKHASIEDNAFVALNTAYTSDGAFIYLPKGCKLSEPVHLVYISMPGDKPTESHPRNLIVAEEDSCATVIESYVAPEESVYFTNAVTEAVIGANAGIDHYKLQRESTAAYHVATIQAIVGRDGRFNSQSLSIGGTLVRNDINAVLDGEGIDCILDGFYMSDGRRHVDNHTYIRHAKPHCDSHELYKGILNGHASGVFNGTIYVNPGAIKTDAKQTNRCMLLSDDAQINTNPQLEIFADDVRCTHGASVGQLDENAVFYMRARGIGEANARHMLVFAFANEVLERIRVAPLRDRVAADLFDWLSSARAA